MRMLDHYISRTIVMSTLMVSAVIFSIQGFLSIVQQLQSVGQQQYSMLHAFLYVLMELPLQFYQLFPMAGFLGAMIGLGKLSASSELIIMRAAGVSMQRIAWSVVKAAIFMVFFMTLIGEGVGPVLQQYAEKMRNHDLSSVETKSLMRSVWLHEKNTFVHIDNVLNSNTLSGVLRYTFSPEGRLLATTSAKSGNLVDGNWQLSGLTHTHFQKNKIKVLSAKTGNLKFIFKPNLQVQMKVVSVQETLCNLYKTIVYRRLIGLGVSQFAFLFWQRILQPITTLVMISLAVPFVFGSYRSMSMSIRILMGVLVGFAFYMMNQLFGPITLIYQFPAYLAAIMPTLLFFLISLVLLARAR